MKQSKSKKVASAGSARSQGSLRQEYIVKAPVARVWKMLTDPKEIREWSGSDAVMKVQAGTRFSLWDDTINGKNIEMLSQKKLVQEWKEEGWDKPSIATFLLSSVGPGTTRVTLIQNNIPKNRVKDIAQGWDDYYLGVIKRTFEKSRD